MITETGDLFKVGQKNGSSVVEDLNRWMVEDFFSKFEN